MAAVYAAETVHGQITLKCHTTLAAENTLGSSVQWILAG